MFFDIVTIFPEFFSLAHFGVLGRALGKGIVNIKCWNPRTYSKDSYGRVDDRPYGGGPGMVMMFEPLRDAIHAAKDAAKERKGKALTIYFSPQGKLLTQEIVMELKEQKNLLLLAGRYEGVDERLVESEIDMELSVGDYVVSGGELPALILIDAITRLLPGVLGDENSAKEDSFAAGILDCPHYTRPEVIDGKFVPGVLLSGNHQEIARWRLKEALGRTYRRRPELLQKKQLTKQEIMLLNDFLKEN
jgi:tRNA (guanine37-N1)-methyltransferase